MTVTQHELEKRYAGEARAGGVRFIAARHVPDGLAKLGIIRPGDHLVAFADDFTDALADRFPRESLRFAEDPSPDAFLTASPAAAGEGRIFWFANAVGGRGLRVPDLRALSAAAHGAGAALIVDDTVPSLLGCRPLELGADLCLEALDRVAAGDLRRKAVAVSWPRPHRPAVDAGTVSSHQSNPLENAALASLVSQVADTAAVGACDLVAIGRGLDTVSARMQRHFDHARAIAAYLSCCDEIPSVSYPGLPSHPDHGVAARTLLHGFGPAVDFGLPCYVTAGTFITRCRFNGRDRPAGGRFTRLSARDGEEGRFIRLFAGLDDPLAIVDDLDQAMRWLCNHPEP